MTDLDKLIKLIPLLSYYPRWVQHVFWVTIIFVVVSLILFFYFLPSALNAKKRIARIEFRNVPPFIDHQVLKNDDTGENWTAYYYSVQIINDSDESSIQVQHLKISDLEILEGDPDTWKYMGPFTVDWDPNNPKTVPPKDKVLARFARVYPPDLQQIADKGVWSAPYDIPQLRFISFRDKGRMTRKMISKVPGGTHRFKLTAYFDSALPATARFELKCPPEKGRTTAEALVKKIAIKMLKLEE